jgi:hypothetical protein
MEMKFQRNITRWAAWAAVAMPFGALAQTEPAQNAPKSVVTPSQAQAQARANPAVVPLKNLQIEVRQVGTDHSQRSSVDAQGRVTVQPGRSRAEGVVSIDQTRSSQSRQLQQQALVLNGRSVSFSLGHTVPMRVVQVLAYKDSLHMVPTAVLIDRNSGFTARPLWYGDDVAEVEISVTLVQGSRQSTVSTTLPVQLNEWITIAQVDDAQHGGMTGILSRTNEQGLSSLHLEMRVSVR